MIVVYILQKFKKMTNYITTYVNPDTDGVACMVAMAEYLSRNPVSPGGPVAPYKPVVFGQPDCESNWVLEKVDLPVPESADGRPPLRDAENIVLVDTHHKSQLPDGFPFDKVALIIDHHPNGDPDAFPNARIINEKIGAAASKVAEMYLAAGLRDEKILRLLAFAIKSNTIDFTTANTSDFDRRIFAEIEKTHPIPAGDISAMFDSRARILDFGLRAALESDLKEFDTKRGRVGISQLSLFRKFDAIDVGRVAAELSAIAADRGLRYLFFNYMNNLEGKSILIAANDETRKMLEKIFGGEFKDNARIFDRTLARKTDLVPALGMM